MRMLSAQDLIGVWRLDSHVHREQDGSTSVGPLGVAATGLLIYDVHGHVSAGLMRGDPAVEQDGSPPVNYMGYSGRWRLSGNCAIHDVEISSHAPSSGPDRSERPTWMVIA